MLYTGTTTLDATVGTSVNMALTATGGRGTYTWTTVAGDGFPSLPTITDLHLDSAGRLSGTPTAAGLFDFSLTVLMG